MEIKSVECSQFAGLINKELDFSKGLNIVIGDNESGKSTIVDLIYQLLFRDVKLGNREKKDKEFLEKYFPQKAVGPSGDVIDGALIFETVNGTYKLKKEWENGTGTCKLTLPDGSSVNTFSTINEILKNELNYQEGVYNEIVFASQKRAQLAVESIMQNLDKADLSATKISLASTLQQVVLETGGISIDKLEKAITEKRNNLIKQWDWYKDAPEGGPKYASYTNPRKKDIGSILKAYYDMDQVKDQLEKAQQSECEVDAIKKEIQKLEDEKNEIEEKRILFQRYNASLKQVSLLNGFKEKLKNMSEEQPKDCPDKLKEIKQSDLNILNDLIDAKQATEAKINGMNIAATIKNIVPSEVFITSVTSGETVNLVDGKFYITEPVCISIPGIMEMQLFPNGVDIETVKNDLAGIETDIMNLLSKYDVCVLKEIFEAIFNPENFDEALVSSIDDYKQQLQDRQDKKVNAEKRLGDISFEELSEILQEKRNNFELLKAEYVHWNHIYEIFCKLKEECSVNPVEDIAKSFCKYLSEITAGTIRLNTMGRDLSVQLESGPFSLNYNNLSEGTRDTISLAFRLAMLEHLYPEGNGLAIFDDPFTDMDPQRVKQSCKLIQKFAENNQVIFVTCDDKYVEFMSGNIISVVNNHK